MHIIFSKLDIMNTAIYSFRLRKRIHYAIRMICDDRIMLVYDNHGVKYAVPLECIVWC